MVKIHQFFSTSKEFPAKNSINLLFRKRIELTNILSPRLSEGFVLLRVQKWLEGERRYLQCFRISRARFWTLSSIAISP